MCCPGQQSGQGDDCSSAGGVPETCSIDCAVLFSNVYNTCHDTLAAIVDQSLPIFDDFIRTCYQLTAANETPILTALGQADCPDQDEAEADAAAIAAGGAEGTPSPPPASQACMYRQRACMKLDPTALPNGMDARRFQHQHSADQCPGTDVDQCAIDQCKQLCDDEELCAGFLYGSCAPTPHAGAFCIWVHGLTSCWAGSGPAPATRRSAPCSRTPASSSSSRSTPTPARASHRASHSPRSALIKALSWLGAVWRSRSWWCATRRTYPPPVLASQNGQGMRLTEMRVVHRTSPIASLDANVDYYQRDCH